MATLSANAVFKWVYSSASSIKTATFFFPITVKDLEPTTNKKRNSTSVQQNYVVEQNLNANYNATEGSDPCETAIEMQVDDMQSEEIEVKPDIVPMSPADDGVHHFLMSLYDCMTELDPIRKIKVQARIFTMLSQEVAEAAMN